MTSNTQENTDRARAQSGTDTGLRGDDPSLSSQPPSSGLGTRDTGTRTGDISESSPVTQQAAGQGTTTGQYDPSRPGEQRSAIDALPEQYGRQTGTETGVGHHKSHHEGHLHGHLHGHGPSEAAKASCETCTKDRATGHGTTGTQTGHPGDTQATEHATPTIPATSSGTGTDDQHLAGFTERHGGATGHQGVPDSHEAPTGPGHLKPKMSDKIIGGMEKVAGKMTSNPAMYQRGEERATGEAATKKN